MDTMNTTETKPVHKFERSGLGKAPFRCVGMTEKVYRAAPDAPAQPGGSCDYCGTGIRYCFGIRSSDGRSFIVGSECVNKTGDAGLVVAVKREMKAHRDSVKVAERAAAAKAWREARDAETATRRAATLAANPDLTDLLATDHPIIRDIAERFAKWGSVSDAQIALVRKIAREAAERAAEVEIAAPTGRQVIRGRVLSVKDHYTQVGYNTVHTWKITVKVTTPAGVWVCWGTCPDSILAPLRDAFPGHAVDALRGRDVEFTATLSPSDRPTFAFFKRPAKAELKTLPTAEEIAAFKG